jgi:hypothetical protein
MVVAMNSVEYRVPEASQLSSEEVLLPVQDNNGSYNLAIRTAKSQGLMSSEQGNPVVLFMELPISGLNKSDFASSNRFFLTAYFMLHNNLVIIHD